MGTGDLINQLNLDKLFTDSDINYVVQVATFPLGFPFILWNNFLKTWLNVLFF